MITPIYLYKKDLIVNQEGKYIYETEIKRIQSLMGVNAVNEQNPGFLLNPIGMRIPQTIQWMKTWDAHDWLTFVDITSGLLGSIPSPASGVLLGISTAACLADGGLWLYEGDDYMGGLVLSFCLIPAGELALMSPRIARSVAKGKKAALNTIKKGRELAKKRTLTKAEKAIVKEADELMSELTKNAEKIAKFTQKNFVAQFVANILKTGGKLLFGTVLLLSKMSWSLGKLGFTIGGIYYTYDQVYLALYGTDEEKMKLRQDSPFYQLVQFLKDPEIKERVVKQVGDYFKKHEQMFKDNPDLLKQVDSSESERLAQEHQKTMKELEEKIKSENQIISPPIQDVLTRKIDPKTKKPYVIEFGQKGESVRKVQEMLDSLEYGLTLKGYNSKKTGVDGDFGNNTFDAVTLFQWKNELKETGIVDSETLKLLTAKSNEKKQENEK